MNRILQVRKSVWAAICLWLGLVRGYQLPAQVVTAQPRIYSTAALEIFNISLTRDSLLRVFGNTTRGYSLGYSPVMQNVDQPTGAFVNRMQQAAPLISRPITTGRTGSGTCSPPTPTPPPLPPVSTLPTAQPVPPLTCTQITEQNICTSMLGRTHCHVNVCCLRGGAIDHCAKISSYSYSNGYPGGTTTRGTTTWHPCTGGFSHSNC